MVVRRLLSDCLGIVLVSAVWLGCVIALGANIKGSLLRNCGVSSLSVEMSKWESWQVVRYSGMLKSLDSGIARWQTAVLQQGVACS